MFNHFTPVSHSHCTQFVRIATDHLVYERTLAWPTVCRSRRAMPILPHYRSQNRPNCPFKAMAKHRSVLIRMNSAAQASQLLYGGLVILYVIEQALSNRAAPCHRRLPGSGSCRGWHRFGLSSSCLPRCLDSVAEVEWYWFGVVVWLSVWFSCQCLDC